MGPKRRYLATLVFGLMLLAAVSSVTGKSYWVAVTGSNNHPGTETAPFATISYAMTWTSAGVIDTVVVRPGVYHDSLTFDTKAVVVRSEKGAKATVIDGSGYNAVILFGVGVPTSTVLDGFTIRDAFQRGIVVQGQPTAVSSPEIKNCIIRSNGGSSSGANGAGLWLSYSRANLHNNLIDSNIVNSIGGGIYCSFAAPSIWSNRIQYNRAIFGSGGGIAVWVTLGVGPILIQNNLIIGNYGYDGGGVYLDADGVLFANNLVYGNSASDSGTAGGLYVYTACGTSQTLINNIFVSNTPYAVDCYDQGCTSALRNACAVYQENCFFGNLPSTQSSTSCPIAAGNLDGVNPQFVDSAGGDFHLSNVSPLINAGATLPPGAYAYDFDGFPRIVGAIDVGPFERTTCDLIASFSPSSILCAKQEVQFTNTSTGRYIMSIWDYGNGVVDSFPNTDVTAPPIAPKAVYATGGVYTVRVKLLCPYDLTPALATRVISIDSKPRATFHANVNQGCVPLTVNFTNSATGGSLTNRWDFGDEMTSTETSPAHNFVQAGVFVVKLVSINDCGTDSVTDTITVDSVSVANFVADPTRGSSVLPVTFTGSATNNPTGWSWDFGDGGTATTQVANHNFTKPGIYDVSLTAINECGAGETKTLPNLITVYGFKLREIDSDTTNRLQQEFRARIDTLYGLFDRSITLNSLISPTPRRGSVTVNFNPTTTQVLDTITATANLSRDFAAGSYQLRVIARSGSPELVDTLIWDFNSHPDTLIRLSAGGMVFDSVQIDTFAIDSIAVRNVSGLQYSLNLHVTKVVTNDPQFAVLDTASGPIQPNGSFYIRVKFTPKSLGEKSAFMTIASDDPALPSLLVTLRASVIGECISTATLHADVKQGCVPLTVNFTSSATGGSLTDTVYFGDGITSTETSPRHVYVRAGIYIAKLMSINACGADSAVDTITVDGVPVANFDANTTRGSSVLPVTFTGSATNNPTGWTWVFGDGDTATTQVANHNFTKPGIYDVSLTATNECGAGETKTLSSLITVYGFKLREIDSDTTNRLQKEFRARIDTLYGLFDRSITPSSSITPTPRRGSATVDFNPTTAQVLDTITATANLSRDLAAGSYQLRMIARSVSNLPVDTLIWDFNSHPDTLIRLSADGIVFDSVQIDTFAIDSIRVRNVSGLQYSLDLHVTNVVTNDPQFAVLDTASGPIQPNGSFHIRVKLMPASLGEKSAFMTITSDDPALPDLLVTLRANVIPERKPPFVVSAYPAHNAVGVLIGSSVDFTLSESIDPASVTTGSIVAHSRRLHANIPGTAHLSAQTRIAFVPQRRYFPYDTIDVRLLATVRDRSGNSLDSDGDGKGQGSPADDYTFWFVTGPAIYPGDCNNDGLVNEMDVLPLGVFYGMTGPRRDSLGEETGWGPKQAIEWSDKRSTYADADGNGIVDAADLLVIALNWGGTQPQANPIFPDGFDYRPYAAGLSSLLSNLGPLEGSAEGDLIVQLLNSYASSTEQTPKQYSLTQNRPNPFNPGTQIGYALPQGSNVTLVVYNVIGQTVRVLVDSYEGAGYRQVVWDGTDQSGREVASGVYFYQLTTDGFSQIRKMVKLR